MTSPERRNVYEYRRDGYLLSTDPGRIDVDYVHQKLKDARWSAGVPRQVVVRAMASSLVFGLYRERQQVGFARVVTNRATFAFLTDVFIDDTWRGKGLSHIIMEGVTSHPDLQGLRRLLLVTRDAHGLYARYGFSDLAHPERFMERLLSQAPVDGIQSG